MKNNRYVAIGLAAITPILGCILFLLYNGIGFTEYSIACSQWNDEFTYYKQVEAIIAYGKPLGFYGFNESHALWGNLGGWSFAIHWPFVLIGKIFGWTYTTPVIFNIVISVIGLVAFAAIMKLTLKQQLVVSGLWLGYSVGLRYIFSASPEVLICVIFLMLLTFMYRYYKTGAAHWMILSDVCLFYLSLMRGYYAAFVLVLIYMAWEKHGFGRKVIYQVIVGAASALGYALIIHYCLAEYFSPDVTIDWVNPLILLKKEAVGALESLNYMWQALQLQSVRGSWYIIYLFVGIFVFYKIFKDKRKGYITAAVVWFILPCALWAIYNSKEGCRHLMACGFIGIIFMSVLARHRWINIVSLVIVFFTTWLSADSFYTDLVKPDQAQIETVAEAQEELTELISLDNDDEWDNTIIWSLSTYFNDLYAVPAGMGINCCEDEFLIENIGNLNSKYIATMNGDTIDALVEAYGGELIYSYGQTNIYKLR